jgi:NAD(P)-dependent dehydrogenase (short-subunit alcohol dehydrogenase family)
MKRIAVVTGAFGVLGSAVCETLARAGWRVAGVDLAATPSHAAVEWLFGGVNLTDAGAVQRIANELAASGAPLGALVNVAGGFRWETLDSGSVETWDRLYETNLKTAVVACKVFVPHFQSGAPGSIVNVGAAAATKAAAGMGAYAASKSGVLRLTEALADELKASDITVNAVLPSILDTPANRAQMPDADFTRWVPPVAVAGVIDFLLSPAARCVNGAGIPVVGKL